MSDFQIYLKGLVNSISILAIEKFVFILGPTVLAFLTLLLANINLFSSTLEVKAACVAFSLYSLGAASVLYTLGENNFLKRIKKKNRFNYYVATICFPFCLSLGCLLGLAYGSYKLAALLFLSAVYHFFWSLFILFLFLRRYYEQEGVIPQIKKSE